MLDGCFYGEMIKSSTMYCDGRAYTCTATTKVSKRANNRPGVKIETYLTRPTYAGGDTVSHWVYEDYQDACTRLPWLRDIIATYP